jgi:hypothetical protein
MSQEQKATHLGPGAYEPHPASPHVGHGGTSFEGGDARPSIVVWSLAIIAGVLVVVFLITVPIQKYLYDANPQGQLPSPLAPDRVVPPTPQLEVHPWETLPALRAHEDQVLTGYSREADGRVHIPIDRAMDAVVPRLKIGTNAEPGATTPGGGGREFAGSVSTLPVPPRGPKIQGEIRKHAQK